MLAFLSIFYVTKQKLKLTSSTSFRKELKQKLGVLVQFFVHFQFTKAKSITSLFISELK